jgi:hypothetical protein
MPYDDLYNIPRPFVPKRQEPDFRSAFWQQSPDMRPNTGREKMATNKVCKYSNGRHENSPKTWCPHYKAEDERGFRIRPDWNVQWDRVNEDGTFEEAD